MALNFPDAPVLDDVYTDAITGKAYTYDGEKWWGSAAGPSLPPAENVFLPLAGGTMSGAIQLPATQPTAQTESTHKQYVDTAISAKALYQGVWQVAANTPDLTPATANPLHSYSWIANTVDPNLPETAPAALPGIGGQLISSSDTVIWNNTTSLYELVRSPASVSGDFVEVTGDTMTGNLLLPAAMPTVAEQAAHKAYVDSMATTGDFVPLAGGTMTGPLNFSVASTINFNAGDSAINFKDTNGGNRWTFGSSNTSFAFINQGKATAFSVDQVTSVVNFAGVPTVGGVQLLRTSGGTVTGQITFSGAILKMPEGTSIQFNNTGNFITSTANNRIRFDSDTALQMHIGPSKFMEIDSGGVEIWGTFTDSLATDLPGSTATDGSVNIGNALALMAAKIKAMDAEIAQLKARR